ncbi:hypothetical protein C7M84_000841 [Penaeus vannamei]|uniref:Uncharacterized protein n=1 Tax=Penaeus vannamei TaxID=6689 RepID=A0A423TVF7_PENVA|nr:hypothetical protein C7M84_000841 [Penaeus vannamei]
MLKLSRLRHNVNKISPVASGAHVEGVRLTYVSRCLAPRSLTLCVKKGLCPRPLRRGRLLRQPPKGTTGKKMLSSVLVEGGWRAAPQKVTGSECAVSSFTTAAHDTPAHPRSPRLPFLQCTQPRRHPYNHPPFAPRRIFSTQPPPSPPSPSRSPPQTAPSRLSHPQPALHASPTPDLPTSALYNHILQRASPSPPPSPPRNLTARASPSPSSHQQLLSPPTAPTPPPCPFFHPPHLPLLHRAASLPLSTQPPAPSLSTDSPLPMPPPAPLPQSRAPIPTPAIISTQSLHPTRAPPPSHLTSNPFPSPHTSPPSDPHHPSPHWPIPSRTPQGPSPSPSQPRLRIPLALAPSSLQPRRRPPPSLFQFRHHAPGDSPTPPLRIHPRSPLTQAAALPPSPRRTKPSPPPALHPWPAPLLSPHPPSPSLSTRPLQRLPTHPSPLPPLHPSRAASPPSLFQPPPPFPPLHPAPSHLPLLPSPAPRPSPLHATPLPAPSPPQPSLASPLPAPLSLHWQPHLPLPSVHPLPPPPFSHPAPPPGDSRLATSGRGTLRLIGRRTFE